jgi:amino-acid N-acetyltransferase
MIRAARSTDTEAIEVLLRAADLPVSGVAGGIDGFVVYERAGRVLGAAGLERYGAHVLLRSLVVAGDTRSQGVGGRLVRERCAAAAALGADDVYLLTETAEGFFARLGFARIPRDDVAAGIRQSEEFVSLCPATAAVMRRPARTAVPAEGGS